MSEVDDLRAVHDRIKRDLETQICSPERLQANLRQFYLILAEMEGGEAHPYDVTRDGIFHPGKAPMAAAHRRSRFEVIDGGRS